MANRLRLCLVILVATGEAFWNGTIFDHIYTHCPFNNFYNRPSDYVRNASDLYESCCTTCKSEPHCGVRVPCCPDYRLQQMTSSCISNVFTKLDWYARKVINKFEQHFWMVETCLPRYQGSTLEINCQHRDVVAFFNATQMKPVLDNNTKIIYANQFCAYCNDVNNSIAYDTFLTVFRCFGKELSVFALKPFSDLNSLFEMTLCHYHFMPASYDVVSESACKPYDVTSCNVTGSMTSFDQTIFDACLTYDLSYTDWYYGLTYKNIHCYFCNTNDQSRVGEWCIDGAFGTDKHVPTFAAILGSPSMTEDQYKVTQTPPAEEICSTIEFYVPDEVISHNPTVMPTPNPSVIDIKTAWIQMRRRVTRRLSRNQTV